MSQYDYNDTAWITVTGDAPTTPAVTRALCALAEVIEQETGRKAYLGSRWGGEVIVFSPETEDSKIGRWLDAEDRWLRDQAKEQADA